MKRIMALTLLVSASLLAALNTGEVMAEAPGRVHHVVIVWLKDHDSAAARERYIEATRSLAELPMVWRYKIGTALPGGREVVDSSYDVAIVATFENAQALDAYLNHPEHRKVLDERLKPLVDKVIVYDLAEVR